MKNIYERALESNDVRLKNEALKHADTATKEGESEEQRILSQSLGIKTIYEHALRSNDLNKKNHALKSAVKFSNSIGDTGKTPPSKSEDQGLIDTLNDHF